MENSRFETLGKDIRAYIEAKTDEYRLGTVAGLAQAMTVLVSVMIVLMLVMGLLLALGFGAALAMGKLIGNYATGAFIMAGVYLILAAVFIAFRKVLFRDSFTKLFAGIILRHDDLEDEEDE